MIMKKCPEGNKEILDSVSKCPDCGYKLRGTNRKKICIIIVIIACIVFIFGGIFGFLNYKNRVIQESKQHFLDGENYYKAEQYDKAMTEYSLVHKWDEENYKRKDIMLSKCKINKNSQKYMKNAERFEANYDYEKAVKEYNNVSRNDEIYYQKAQDKISKLKEILDDADLILSYSKSVTSKFGLKNASITDVYYSRGNGFLADTEVAIKYQQESDKLYIVTKKKQTSNDYATVYKVKKSPKYISVLGEVKQEYGWFASSIVLLREKTAETYIETVALVDTTATPDLLNYIRRN